MPSRRSYPVPPALLTRGRLVGGGTTAVMGILNVTPDSFSDGGLWVSEDAATEHGIAMYQAGAAIVDVGGESTRPGAARVGHQEEVDRVGAVIRNLVREGVPVSIDTVRSKTARVAVELGAILINDVSGGRVDSEMAEVCISSETAMVVQHWRGFPSDPNLNLEYGDVVSEVVGETSAQVLELLNRGVPKSHLVVDPGLGFGLRVADSWKVVQSLDSFAALGFPVLIGASRKRFVAQRYGTELEQGTQDVTELGVRAGVWAVRVHQVGPNVRLISELAERRLLTEEGTH